MDTRRQELLAILGHTVVGVIEAHERRERTRLTPHSARQLLPCWSMPAIGSRPGHDRGTRVQRRAPPRDTPLRRCRAPPRTGA